MFTEEEVWAVIRDSDGNRAPGPDGFNMSFFKRYWASIKDEFMKFFSDLYHNQNWDASLNHSFITLIPKKPNPVALDEFRPISLLNCAYKILANVLGRRLRMVLDQLISKSQLAFIQGRQILDCSMIANEVIDSVYQSGSSGVAFKIDFKKAYDSVDWNFLLRIMKGMGFGVRWRRWIHRCVSTASISVLVNGAPTDRFSISKGLRQGCPLSPLLFNLVGEALSLMLYKAVGIGLFKGIQIGSNSNSVLISHLQFADDLLVFCEASGSQVLAVKRVLRVFELASGLRLNLKKSKVFGMNVDQEILLSWANSIGCSMGFLPTEYLGLPLGVRHNSIKLWEPILKKLSTKLVSWKSHLLSFGGRICLVKSVLSSLSVYFMSLFRMPVAVTKRITGMVSNFLWGGASDKRRIHWVSWSLLCQPLENGGLGLLDFGTQNRCLLVYPSPPVSRKSSWVWKGIMNSSFADDSFGHIFQNNLCLRVGDGRFIRFWSDIWLCDQPLSTKFPRIFALAINKIGVIAEFGVRRLNHWVWDIHLRRCLFDWEVPSWNELLSLLESFQSSGLGRDWVQWVGSSDGLYSIKSLKLQLNLASSSEVNWKKMVWIGLAPPKVEAFMWLILHERVPVKVELLKRGVSGVADDLCPFCNQAKETVEHLFFTCSVAWQLWVSIASRWGVSLVLHHNPLQFMVGWPHICSKLSRDIMWLLTAFAIVWTLWLHRNDIIFQGKSCDPAQLAFNAKLRAAWWWKARNTDSSILLDSIIADPSLPSSSGKASPVSRALEGKCGVGGVLRDENGSTLMEFSLSIGYGSAFLAEILAIKFAVERFMSSLWADRSRLVIESDSSTTVAWVLNPSLASSPFSELVQGIHPFFTDGCWFIRHIRRIQNVHTDFLAKAGIG
ncbi:hypothetical protein GQ457_12G031020 [Hibiscus cannabinus]